jgi:hypothetical protein
MRYNVFLKKKLCKYTPWFLPTATILSLVIPIPGEIYIYISVIALSEEKEKWPG